MIYRRNKMKLSSVIITAVLAASFPSASNAVHEDDDVTFGKACGGDICIMYMCGGTPMICVEIGRSPWNKNDI
jgi:hypothetical protein